MIELRLLIRPTRYLFFTGKGGAGKTSLAGPRTLALADAGKSVLLVSTDAVSNLDEILDVESHNMPMPVPVAPGLKVLNIDPDTAAETYRQRVLAQMEASASTTGLESPFTNTPLHPVACKKYHASGSPCNWRL